MHRRRERRAVEPPTQADLWSLLPVGRFTSNATRRRMATLATRYREMFITLASFRDYPNLGVHTKLIFRQNTIAMTENSKIMREEYYILSVVWFLARSYKYHSDLPQLANFYDKWKCWDHAINICQLAAINIIRSRMGRYNIFWSVPTFQVWPPHWPGGKTLSRKGRGEPSIALNDVVTKYSNFLSVDPISEQKISQSPASRG